MSIRYDDIAPTYARHRTSQAFVIEELCRLWQLSPGGRSLEVGCGTGLYVNAVVVRTGCHGYGLDPSREMLREASRSAGGFHVQGEAGALPFATGSFSFVFSVNMIHHLMDPLPFMGQSLRILDTGGIFCTVTDSEAIIARREPLARYWPSTVSVDLDRYHSLDSLRSHMTELGFRGIDGCEKGANYAIGDSGPYRDQAFSCLKLIAQREFAAGLETMEADLAKGPVRGSSEFAFLWGVAP